MEKINVLVTVPMPLRGLIVTDEALARLDELANVTLNEDGRNWTAGELAAKLPSMDAIVASWGLPKLTAEVLAGADRLKVIGYGAGSVKGWATDALYDRGVRVSHAAFRIADSVAETTLLMAMMGLRQLHVYDRRLKAGEPWPKTRTEPVFEIAGSKVGLLGMGYVGRRSARLFNAVGADVWAYDPYMSAERAAQLGVKKAELDDLLGTCKVISVHLPVTDETHHMLGARELALIQDGAVFVNTARAWTVDQEAMVAELSTGRFWAALDVFDPEPLPVEHPLRAMDNVLLTPHMAGLSRESYAGLMSSMIDEVQRFFQGEPLQHEVRREMLATMA